MVIYIHQSHYSAACSAACSAAAACGAACGAVAACGAACGAVQPVVLSVVQPKCGFALDSSSQQAVLDTDTTIHTT
jgi:hypothetical protein